MTARRVVDGVLAQCRVNLVPDFLGQWSSRRLPDLQPLQSHLIFSSLHWGAVAPNASYVFLAAYQNAVTDLMLSMKVDGFQQLLTQPAHPASGATSDTLCSRFCLSATEKLGNHIKVLETLIVQPIATSRSVLVRGLKTITTEAQRADYILVVGRQHLDSDLEGRVVCVCRAAAEKAHQIMLEEHSGEGLDFVKDLKHYSLQFLDAPGELLVSSKDEQPISGDNALRLFRILEDLHIVVAMGAHVAKACADVLLLSAKDQFADLCTAIHSTIEVYSSIIRQLQDGGRSFKIEDQTLVVLHGSLRLCRQTTTSCVATLVHASMQDSVRDLDKDLRILSIAEKVRTLRFERSLQRLLVRN